MWAHRFVSLLRPIWWPARLDPRIVSSNTHPVNYAHPRLRPVVWGGGQRPPRRRLRPGAQHTSYRAAADNAATLAELNATWAEDEDLNPKGAPSTTPLCSYRPSPTSPFIMLKSKSFTDVLRVQAHMHGARHGLTPDQISVGSFRTTGAMALFNAGVDSTRIRLIGRWNSWAMLRYLHVQSNTTMAGFASQMLSGGSHTSLVEHPPPDREPENPNAGPVIVPAPDDAT